MNAKQDAIDARLAALVLSIVVLQASFQEFAGHPFQSLWRYDVISDELNFK